MQNTPTANRKTVVLVGNRNAGKSTLFNLILGQDRSIVSDFAGTTTDPVFKAMELIGYGPINLVDTAGLDDEGDLGKMRVEKSQEEIMNSDVIIHVISIEDLLVNKVGSSINDILNENSGKLSCENIEEYIINRLKIYRDQYDALNKKHIFIVSKLDLLDESVKDILKSIEDKFNDIALFSSEIINSEISKVLENYKTKLVSKLISVLESTEEEKGLLHNIAEKGNTILLVVPVDSEAPKGRLILPQVQVIRECLDLGIKVIVVRDTELEEILEENKNIDLVITDSQIFEKVDSIISEDMKLTSFSILFARQKGDIEEFIEGAKYIYNLKDGNTVLIAESCTHTVSHEDIGTVKIPNLIKKKTGKDIKFSFSHGKNIPGDLSKYAMIIHCGGCMVTRTSIMNKVNQAKLNNVPITNYGIVLAYLKGVIKDKNKGNLIIK